MGGGRRSCRGGHDAAAEAVRLDGPAAGAAHSPPHQPHPHAGCGRPMPRPPLCSCVRICAYRAEGTARRASAQHAVDAPAAPDGGAAGCARARLAAPPWQQPSFRRSRATALATLRLARPTVAELVAGNSMNVAHLPFPPRMYVAIFLPPALPYSSAIAALAPRRTRPFLPCQVLECAPEWTVALARRCSAAMRPANSGRACSRGCTWPPELKMRRPERRPADRRACNLPVRRLALHCAVVRPPPRAAARGRRPGEPGAIRRSFNSWGSTDARVPAGGVEGGGVGWWARRRARRAESPHCSDAGYADR